MNVLINGISAGGGGGYTVAVELSAAIALANPDWQVTTMFREDLPLHREARRLKTSTNHCYSFRPENLRTPSARRRFECRGLRVWTDQNDVDVCINLNGMLFKTLGCPMICHFQDPWAYRPEAWSKSRDRARAFLKRRAHRQALFSADACTWTSHYLQNLIVGYHGTDPDISEVVYNGVPDAWLRLKQYKTFSDRSNTIITLGNVNAYKRQSLVMKAVASLSKITGDSTLRYHILGSITDTTKAELTRLAKDLDVEEQVMIEGRVSVDRIKYLLSSARVKVLMSVCESFGIPCIEAMSEGCVVIAARSCALPEVCGDAAILTEPDDLEQLTDQLGKVLKDEPWGSQLQKKGIERSQQFAWSAAGKTMSDVCRKVVAKQA